MGRKRAWIDGELYDRYLAKVGNHEHLSVKEEHALLNTIKTHGHNAAESTSAKKEIVLHNMQMIIREARKYLGRSGLGIEDLVNHGVVGAYEAFTKFDYGESRKTRFMTYASYWVRHAIQKAVHEEGSIIAIPNSQIEVLNRIRKAVKKLEELGKELTYKAVAKEAKVSPVTVENFLTKHFTGKHEDFVFVGSVNKLSEPMPENIDEIVEVRIALGSLNQRQREVITRIVINGETLREVAEDLSISAERVNQIKHRALEILRKTVKKGG